MTCALSIDLRRDAVHAVTRSARELGPAAPRLLPDKNNEGPASSAGGFLISTVYSFSSYTILHPSRSRQLSVSCEALSWRL